ncbi:hypothetical protein KPL28_09540 [Clostridium algidicarnis]|uniref:hypothetical protein n=1 Tax=Clostridium algidicarnis TaxID=37659 RepID=UPI001C0CB258|nr:hypothetical protein [Clostridium algidicarnis]MBU3209862.1 hypothetical protein [Clostridium algidicarnis]
MKGLDLHIHTIATKSDAKFEFDLENLKKYVIDMDLHGIAITNHNLFEINQYKSIARELDDIIVFAGIEINLEGGHLLLISETDDIEEFCIKCKKIEDLIEDPKDYITIKQLKEIYYDLDKYLLIPHYAKKPKLRNEIIEDLQAHVFCGEVGSIKDFLRLSKDDKSLTPMWFSDLRASDNYDDYKHGVTYFDIDDVTLKEIKIAVKDKTKVKLSKTEGNHLFKIDKKGLFISTGLNVVIGERSSGKSYLLDYIYENFENVKYIRQFSLLEKDEEKAVDEFNKKINYNKSTVSEQYLSEFKSVVEEIADIDLDTLDKSIENYISTLKKYAEEIERKDSFSSAKLFNDSVYYIEDLKSLNDLISSIETILKNTEYQTSINEFIDRNKLIDLAENLITVLKDKSILNSKKGFIHGLMDDIKNKLRLKTSSTIIEDIGLENYITSIDKINKFEKLVTEIKKERVFYEADINKFVIHGEIKKFTGAQEVKNLSGSTQAFSTAYSQYKNGYNYLSEIKKLSIPKSDYYKYFVKVDYNVKNRYGFNVSGGERAEFNLLKEIQDALKYDLLLIDEPESSFDNLFLKHDVNQLIKSISNIIPVIIVTHNNTVGISIKPDYLICTKREILENNIVEYKTYLGHPTSNRMTDEKGEETSSLEIILNCLEAGEDTYEERKENYELLKDRKQ